MSRAAVLAVDGGNSKTDLALVGADGSLLSLVRGPLSSPQHLGVDGCLSTIDGLLTEALGEHEAGGCFAASRQGPGQLPREPSADGPDERWRGPLVVAEVAGDLRLNALDGGVGPEAQIGGNADRREGQQDQQVAMSGIDDAHHAEHQRHAERVLRVETSQQEALHRGVKPLHGATCRSRLP